MRSWTRRQPAELEAVKRTGFLKTATAKADLDPLVAYDWMANQLRVRIGHPPSNVTYPIWVWKYCYGTFKPRPDLRTRCLLPKGTAGVLLELDLPENQVLLSNFDAWHAILNNHHYSPNDAEYEKIEALSALKSSNHPDLIQLKKASWERIFDLSLIPDPATYAVQGVVWQVPIESIKKTTFFTAK